MDQAIEKVVSKCYTMVNGELCVMMTLTLERQMSFVEWWVFLEPSLQRLKQDLALEMPVKIFYLTTCGAVDTSHRSPLVHSGDGVQVTASTKKMLE